MPLSIGKETKIASFCKKNTHFLMNCTQNTVQTYQFRIPPFLRCFPPFAFAKPFGQGQHSARAH